LKDRRLLIIFGIVLVDMLSFSLVLPLLPYYAKTFGANPVVTGLIFSAYPFAQVFAAPVLGRLSDRHGRKPVLMLSIAGTVGALLLLGFSNSLLMLLASRLLDGITGGNISVAQAYMTDVTSEADRGKAFGLIGAAFGIGFILGPALSGVLSGSGMHVPPFVAAGFAAVNILLVATVLPESLTPGRRAEVAAAPPHRFDLHGLGAALRLPVVGPLLWVRIVVGFSFAVFEGGFTLWAAHALGVGPTVNAYILTYVGVIQVIIQGAVIGPLTKRFSDAVLIVGATALAGVSLGVWGFSPNLWVLAAVIPFISLGMAVTNTILGSALTKAVRPEQVGGMVGLSTSLGSLTRIPAPATAGLLLQAVSPWAPGLLAGLLTAATVPYAYARILKATAAPNPPSSI
jgi:DHA1 family tetracycline resistance protein-like MFS transporter